MSSLLMFAIIIGIVPLGVFSQCPLNYQTDLIVGTFILINRLHNCSSNPILNYKASWLNDFKPTNKRIE